MLENSTKKCDLVPKEKILLALKRVNGNVRNVRKYLDWLNRTEAWKLLGYRSYRAMAKERLKMGDSVAYREAQAARVERTLEVAIGSIRESVLRVLFGLADDERRKAFAKAKKDNRTNNPTAEQVRTAAEQLGYLDAKGKKKDPNDQDGILKKIAKIEDQDYLKRISLAAQKQAKLCR